MKQKLILVLVVALLGIMWSITTSAAGAVVSLGLTDVTLQSCANSTFSGTYRLTAYDAQGNVVNSTTTVNAVGVYQANGVTTSDEYKHTTALAHYDIFFAGTSLSSGTFYFYWQGNSAVVSPTYLLDCATLTATQIGGGSGSGGDDRLNPNTGDLINVLYARTDAQGNPEIHVYVLNTASQGILIGKFAYAQFLPYLYHTPQQNRQIAKIADSTLYALSTGEFQINIGPDAEGKLYSVILDAIPLKKVTLRTMVDGS